MELKISEIFKSIQGEGPWIGRVCTFVRLSGCNMGCSWCDTYQREHQTLNIDHKTLSDSIMGENVVITGGEPLVQSRSLFKLIAELKSRNKKIAIETNGTILPNLRVHEEKLPDLMVISPKIDHSKIDDMKSLFTRWERYKFPKVYKFVVVDKRDVDFVLACADEGVITGDIILQPCEPEKKAVPYIMEKAEWLERFGIRLIPQTHKYLKVQ